MKISVSERALMQRINRKLSSSGKVLKKSRNLNGKYLGTYFIINKKEVVLRNINIEKLGHTLEVIKNWEEYRK